MPNRIVDLLTQASHALRRLGADAATLTHRAEAAEREASGLRLMLRETAQTDATGIGYALRCQQERDEALSSAALWRERCNKAEARVEAMQSSRSLCIEALRGVQATGDVDEQTWDVVADGIRALMAERDALALDKSVVLDQLRESEESECSLRAKLARAEGVVAAARAVAREHDRYLSDEVGPMGHVDEACDALRAALATYEEG